LAIAIVCPFAIEASSSTVDREHRPPSRHLTYRRPLHLKDYGSISVATLLRPDARERMPDPGFGILLVSAAAASMRIMMYVEYLRRVNHV
jgi:hypothetical protein